MSENLTPSVTPADIDRHYDSSVPDHKHELVSVQGLLPVLEDMAAIFHEQRRWAEVVDSYTDHRRGVRGRATLPLRTRICRRRVGGQVAVRHDGFELGYGGDV